MTDSDLTKYDWWRRLGDGGSGDYPWPRPKRINVSSPNFTYKITNTYAKFLHDPSGVVPYIHELA